MSGHSSLSVAIKHEDLLSCDQQMAFDSDINSSLSPYQSFTGYASQEHNPLAFDYPVHPNTVNSLTNMLTDSSPFTTVAPSATSGPSDVDTRAYNLTAEIAELSLSSPMSSPLYHATSLGSSPILSTISQPQPPQVCDPKELDSPVITEQHIIHAGPSSEAEGSHRSRAPSYRAPTVDSDYSPSGESEVEDDGDRSWGTPPSKKKARSARVSRAAHPYLKPAAKPKGDKRRGTKIEIPIPVPGLTKNSRGRCVPKKTEGFVEDGSRPFWCHVQDCDKLFSRGEHLKRHILSIHTQAKRETLPSRFLVSPY